MILTARGAEQHRTGTDTAQAFINLALALGLPGRPCSGYGTITGQGNGQGGREHGQKADQLPGYRRLDDPAARAHVAAVWGIDPAELPRPGQSAFEMLDRLGTDGGVRALLVLASNIVVSAPDANRVADRLRGARLPGRLRHLPVRDRGQLADVVLPTTQWAEEDGTMTNLEGRVIAAAGPLPPPHGVRGDLQVMAALADRLGRGQFFSATRGPCSTSCAGPAPAASPTTPGSATSASTPSRGCSGPARRRTIPARRGCSPTASRPRTGRAAVLPGRPQRAGRGADRRLPVRADHRPDGQQYQSGTQTRRVPRCPHAEPDAASCTPTWPAASARRRRPGAVRTRRGTALFRAVGQRAASARTPSSCRSTTAGRPAPTRSPTPRSTRTPGCRRSRSVPPTPNASAVPMTTICYRHPRPAATSASTRDPTRRVSPGDSNHRRHHRRKDDPCPAESLPAGRLRFTGPGIDKLALLAPAGPRRSGRLHHPAAVLPRRQHQRRAGRGRAAA